MTANDSASGNGLAMAVLNAIQNPVVMVDVNGHIVFANWEAEAFFGASAAHLARYRISTFIPFGSPLLSLIEQAQKNVDMAEAQKVADKLKSGKGFDLDDFKSQMLQMRKMGGMGALMDKMPAQLAGMAGQINSETGDKAMRRMEGIINSMTAEERRKPEIIKATRKRRIAAGAGVQVQEVNRLLNQFEEIQKMMKMFSKGGMSKMMRAMQGRFPGMR